MKTWFSSFLLYLLNKYIFREIRMNNRKEECWFLTGGGGKNLPNNPTFINQEIHLKKYLRIFLIKYFKIVFKSLNIYILFSHFKPSFIDWFSQVFYIRNGCVFPNIISLINNNNNKKYFKKFLQIVYMYVCIKKVLWYDG